MQLEDVLKIYEGYNLPDALQRFYQYYFSTKESFIDLEIVEDVETHLRGLAGKKAKNFLMIGKHGSDSVIAFWLKDDSVKKNLEKAPIVWLDSEGTPNGVVADSVTGFLSLLPYDTGFLYDALSGIIEYEKDPENVTAPNDYFDKNTLQTYIDSAGKKHEGYSSFVKWLTGEIGIQVNPEPVREITQAYERHPKLENWLKQK